MTRDINKTIREIFHTVQFNKTCHQSNLKKLKVIYEQNEFREFWESFVSCFRVPLSISQRHPRVENTLQFIAKFAASLYSTSSDDESDELTCPFVAELFNFILKNHYAKDKGIRFRICYFLNLLLNSLGDQAAIDDVLCNQITASMMDRLLDKSPKVRAQAIFALHRLQDPGDEECPVIKMYMFHAAKDPVAEVRTAALLSMGKNQKTLQIGLRRTRDVNERVRKAAYEFLSKITVRSLTIKQRDQLLNDGLKDRSEIVKRCVQNVLLPSWLRYFNGDFISLLRALDAEIATDISMLSLESLFKSSPLNTVLEQLPIEKNTKLIPLNDLTSENVLYWKCLVKYLQKETNTEELERIIPELSTFCAYISKFITIMSEKQCKAWENQTRKFILLQLFEITTTFDLSDEVGRKNLNELICDTLTTDHCSEKIIECIVSHLQKVIPDVNTRLNILANIINDIRLPLKETGLTQQISEDEQHQINLERAKLKVKLLELKEKEYQAIQDKQYLEADKLKNEITALNNDIINLSKEPQVVIDTENLKEKNDPETMIKCLSIACTMMQSVTVLTPTLRSLMQMALDSLDHSDDTVHIVALKVVGICCILDKELAKKHIWMLFLQFSLEQENPEIWIVALKAIFDLLLLYGMEYFEIVETPNETNKSDKSRTVKLYRESENDISLSESSKINGSKENISIIKILSGLLDNANQGLRTIAAEGFCKLLLNRRISGSDLLSRLIILCYNPANDHDFYLRQCLTGFFDNFVLRVPDGQEMLEEAFLPTLQILCSAPTISPLHEIDPYDVSRFILNMTRHSIRKGAAGNCCVHNSLVFMILAEVLNPNSKIDQTTLIRSLKDLHLDLDENMSKENLRGALDKVKELLQDSSRRLLKCVEEFRAKLDGLGAAGVSEDDDSETDEG